MPKLVIVCGLPSTGKSTVANILARKIGAAVLRTDRIRKEVFEAPKYTEEEKELIYKITFLIARYLLRARRNVILDGTFYKKAVRGMAYKIAEDTRSKLIVVECTAPEEVVQQRMKKREMRKGLSDADYEVYKKIKAEYEPIEEEHIVLDTSKSIKELYEKVFSII